MTLAQVSILAFVAPFAGFAGGMAGQIAALGFADWAPRMAAEVFPACTTEDSTLCFWDAATRGNGQGASFLALSDSLIFTFHH